MKKSAGTVFACVLTAALLLTACGGEPAPSSIPASSTAQSQSAPGPAGYNNSLITEKSKQAQVKNADGEMVSCSYRLPQLLAETPDAARINEEIRVIAGEGAYTAAMEAIEAGEFPPVTGIRWTSYWHGSMLSLVVEIEDMHQGSMWLAYNYDFETGSEVPGGMLLELANATPEQFSHALRCAAAQEFDRMNAGFAGQEFDTDVYNTLLELRAQTISKGNLDAAALYLDEDGKLAAVTTIDTPAGGGTVQAVLYPLDTAAQSRQGTEEYHFIQLDMNQGGAYVTLSEKAASVLPPVQWDVPYPVEGLYGHPVDFAAGRLPGIDPVNYVLCWLDENGWLTFCDLELGASMGGRFIATGPVMLPGHPVSLEVEEGTGRIYALDAKGQEIDLTSAVTALCEFIPSAVQKTSWDLPGAERSLEIYGQEPDQLEWADYAAEQVHSGWYRWLGMTGDGLVYGCWISNFMGPTGCLLVQDYTPDWERVPGTTTMTLTHLTGDALVDLPEGGQVVLERAYG